jgi:hypothetical protein
MYSSTLSWPTPLEGGEGSASRPGRSLPPGKDSVPIAQEAGWAPGPVWTGAENLAPPPGFHLRTVDPVASCYTDWATRPTSKRKWRHNSVTSTLAGFTIYRERQERCTGNEKQTSVKMFHCIWVLGFNTVQESLKITAYWNNLLCSGQNNTSLRGRS